MFRSLVRPAVAGRPGRMGGIACGVVVGVLAASPVKSAQAEPAQAPPAQAEAPKNPFLFMGDGSLLINYVKADKTADFEMVMEKVKEAIAKSENPERKAQAEGWKVFKTDLPGPGGAVTYFVIVDPVIKGNDYNMRAILTEAFGIPEADRIYRMLADSVSGQQLVTLNLALSFK